MQIDSRTKIQKKVTLFAWLHYIPLYLALSSASSCGGRGHPITFSLCKIVIFLPSAERRADINIHFIANNVIDFISIDYDRKYKFLLVLLTVHYSVSQFNK